MNKSKKAMELPLNIIIMLIIGLVIFSLGLGIFSRIADSSESQVAELEDRVKTGIASLECDGEDWICVPKVNVRNGKSQTFSLFISNRGETSAPFSVSLTSPPQDRGCGTVSVLTYSEPVTVESKESAEIPFIVDADEITDLPCSVIGTFTLLGGDSNSEKATLIVAVE